ncbi:MAG: secretin N-terminal domain-containing protein [Pseudomonadota bacterium]
MASITCLAILSACSSSQPVSKPFLNVSSYEPAKLPDRENDTDDENDATLVSSTQPENAQATDALGPRSGLIGSGTVPSIAKVTDRTGPAATPPEFKVQTVDAAVPPLPLPEFIDLAFGRILGLPYQTGPGVAEKKDLVQLRSSGDMAAETFFSLVSNALQDYGVRVLPGEGVYRVLLDNELRAQAPRFVKSRARASTPQELRPIIQFVQLKAVRADDMRDILEQAFGETDGNLRISADENRNYITLTGLPNDIDAALDVIEEMDELRYAGTTVQQYTPLYWPVRQLAAELSNVLSAEGWQVSQQAAVERPILVMPIGRNNTLLIFSKDREARRRANYWLGQLDRQQTGGNANEIFIYDVKNTDANSLAEIVNAVLVGTPPGEVSAQDALQATVQGGAGQEGPTRGSSFIVDPAGNRLIFSGTRSEYDRVRPMLVALDEPVPEVLIEVRIVQVTLADSISSGVEWTVQNIGISDSISGVIQQSSLGLGGGGLDVSIIPNDATVEFNAFADNSQVDVLSTPRLVARSGSAATVNVGSEIPILSAQRLPVGPGGGGNVDVISSVEYRSTGIILNIEPVVYSDNRIDINVSQEVSATLPGGGPIASPSFSNTSVTTELSLEDGATAVIGGLIQDSISRGETGIPFLKDIPGIGSVFSVRDTSIDRTELVIVITAYILRGQSDKEYLAKTMLEKIDATIAKDNLITLRQHSF